MASAFEKAWKSAHESEDALFKAFTGKEKEPTFDETTYHLSEFRTACQNAIFLDFEAARSIDVEQRLWDAHVKINNRFRKLLARFRDDRGKKRPVEKRKLDKHYLEFVKSSQRFYRGYIQRLDSTFQGIAELQRVAQKFNFSSLSTEPLCRVNEDLRKKIIASCHSTLIRLGDLSRYRETELVVRDRNWGPAIGYYDLASAINPASGASHNQLAVIALADANHLKATYHLYMALSAHNPYPTARGNLEIEFKKIRSLWEKKELIPAQDAGVPGKALTPWFVYLHAQCYKGADFSEHDELENEVMSQLAVDLKERPLENTLQKFCLINIAAEVFSRIRTKDDPSNNAPLFFQRINVKTFFTLLQILLSELERIAVEDSENNEPKKDSSDKITAVARRVLPAIRQYSSWLFTNNSLLVAESLNGDTPLSVQIKEFWKIYANTLTLLASCFDVVNLPEVDYLLEEDEEVLGFQPLSNETTLSRYVDVNGNRKRGPQDKSVERHHPNVEMLFRIRQFVIDGLSMVVEQKIPIVLADDKDRKIFVFQEEGIHSQFFPSPNHHQHALTCTSIEREDIQRSTQFANPSLDNGSAVGDGASQSASASVTTNAAMHRMVDALVESETAEHSPPSSSFSHLHNRLSGMLPGLDGNADWQFQSSINPALADPENLNGLHGQVPAPAPPPEQAFSPRPTLPSILHSPFALQPGEATSPRTRPGTARRMSPPGLSLQTPPATGEHFLAEPMSSYTAFQHSLLQQKELLHSSPASPFSTGLTPVSGDWESYYRAQGYSFPRIDGYLNQAMGDYANNGFLGVGHGATFSSSPLANTPIGSGRSRVSQMGVVGRTPPSGQDGG